MQGLNDAMRHGRTVLQWDNTHLWCGVKHQVELSNLKSLKSMLSYNIALCDLRRSIETRRKKKTLKEIFRITKSM